VKPHRDGGSKDRFIKPPHDPGLKYRYRMWKTKKVTLTTAV
jgi:hypothetical protein